MIRIPTKWKTFWSFLTNTFSYKHDAIFLSLIIQFEDKVQELPLLVKHFYGTSL